MVDPSFRFRDITLPGNCLNSCLAFFCSTCSTSCLISSDVIILAVLPILLFVFDLLGGWIYEKTCANFLGFTFCFTKGWSSTLSRLQVEQSALIGDLGFCTTPAELDRKADKSILSGLNGINPVASFEKSLIVF